MSTSKRAAHGFYLSPPGPFVLDTPSVSIDERIQDKLTDVSAGIERLQAERDAAWAERDNLRERLAVATAVIDKVIAQMNRSKKSSWAREELHALRHGALKL